MATTVRVEVKGLRELGLQLKALQKDIQTKVARAAISAGATVIKKRAVRNALAINRGAPDTDGEFLAPNIIQRRQRRSKLTAESAVTVRHKGAKAKRAKDGANAYQVGVFNEFGTVKMSAVPFMRPAFDSGKQEALTAITKRLQQRIDRANKAK